MERKISIKNIYSISTAGRKRMIVRATAIIGLICAAAAIVLSVISSIM